jgi:hypothetical protein
MIRFVTGLCEAPFFPGITLSMLNLGSLYVGFY